MAKAEQLPGLGRSGGYKARLGGNRVWYRLNDAGQTLINPLRYPVEWLMERATKGELFNIRVEYNLEPLVEYIREFGIPDRFTGYSTVVPLTEDLIPFAHEDEIKKGEFLVFVLTDGYRRSLSAFTLLEQGLPLQDAEIPIDSEPIKSDEEYLSTMIRKGSGKPLTMLEKAEAARRLKQVYGWTNEKIAKIIPNTDGELGISTVQAGKLQTLALATTNTKALIKEGAIAATTVIELLRENGSDANQVEQIVTQLHQQAQTETKTDPDTAKSSSGNGAKRSQITPKITKKTKVTADQQEVSKEEILAHLKSIQDWEVFDDKTLKKVYQLVK
jgi:hypothetical protein